MKEKVFHILSALSLAATMSHGATRPIVAEEPQTESLIKEPGELGPQSNEILEFIQAYRDSNENRFKDPGESPLSGIEICVQQPLEAPKVCRRTGADGNVAFNLTQDEEFQATVTSPGPWARITTQDS